MIAELGELLAMHDDPTTYSGEIVERIVDIIPRYGLDLILSQLPDNWSQALLAWIAVAYDSVDPKDDLIYINNPDGPQQMAHIKAWMSQNPTFQSRLVSDVHTLVALKQDRIFSKHQLMDQLVRVSADQGADAVISQLAEPLREAFIAWTRAHFLNDGVPLRRRGEREVKEWLTQKELNGDIADHERKLRLP